MRARGALRPAPAAADTATWSWTQYLTLGIGIDTITQLYKQIINPWVQLSITLPSYNNASRNVTAAVYSQSRETQGRCCVLIKRICTKTVHREIRGDIKGWAFTSRTIVACACTRMGRGVRSARVPIKFKNGSMEESSRPTYILRVLSRHNGSTLYSISF